MSRNVIVKMKVNGSTGDHLTTLLHKVAAVQTKLNLTPEEIDVFMWLHQVAHETKLATRTPLPFEV